MSAIVNFNFNPFPSLATEHLTLRQINSEDEHEFHILKSDSQILKYLNSKPKTFDESRHFLQKIKDGIVKNEWILWGINEKNNNKLLGTVCLWNISEDHSKAEIGYELMPIYQGKGIMQEAVTTVIGYGFKTMKLHSIEAILDVHNLKSIKLLTRTNFVKQATYQENISFEGKCIDMVIYKLEKCSSSS